MILGFVVASVEVEPLGCLVTSAFDFLMTFSGFFPLALAEVCEVDAWVRAYQRSTLITHLLLIINIVISLGSLCFLSGELKIAIVEKK